MHDLESFFWVLFWICIHYKGPEETRVVARFGRWNFVDTEELACMKKSVTEPELYHSMKESPSGSTG